MPRRSGLVSATVLAMVLVGAFSGAIVGLILASMQTSVALLAVITALVAVVLALAVSRMILGARPELSWRSTAVLWNVAIATLIGALAGHEMSVDLSNPPSSPLIGAMSGLLASVLITSFAITVVWLMDQRPGD